MISSELAFRGTAPIVQDTEKVRNVAIPPLPGWESSTQNIVFVVPSSGREWISSQFGLEMEFSVTKADGKPMDPGTNAAFLNLPIASFFQSVRLNINGTIVEGLENNWQMRSWLTSVLSLSYISKKYYGRDLYKYVPDTAFQAQEMSADVNPGFGDRKQLAANSQHVYVRSPIPFSFSTANLALPTGVSLEICLVNAPEDKRIMSRLGALKITFHKLRLLVRYMLLNPATDSSLTNRLNAGSLTYPYLNCRLLNVQTLATGLLESVITVSRGEVPELILVGVHPTSLDVATPKVNWMTLGSHGLRYIQAEVDGEFFPQDGYQMNFETSEGTYSLYESFTDICKLMSGDGSASYEEFVGGNLLIPIQLAEHLPSLRYNNPKKTGLLTVKLRFADQLKLSMNVFIFAISSTALTINRNRSVMISGTQ